MTMPETVKTEMTKPELKHLIAVAAGRQPADLVIRGAWIVDVLNQTLIGGQDVAICGGWIAGLGHYEGREILDARGAYLSPGFIDAHIHIESSYVTPEELGALLLPHGTAAIIADPHEIVNVCGAAGLHYMQAASRLTPLDIRFMYPSCVPATPFETNGAEVTADLIAQDLDQPDVLGLGEFMNVPAVLAGEDWALDELLLARRNGRLIDGHSPGLKDRALDAYISAGVHTDHECSTVEEMQDRLRRGQYVLLREGSACHDLRPLLKGVTVANSRHLCFCSDDRQAETILTRGHLDEHLRIAVQEGGLNPLLALSMATINAAECFRLFDRGQIAPGLRADLVLLEDLWDFKVRANFIGGVKVAEQGRCLVPLQRQPLPPEVRSSFKVRDFSADRLRLPLATGRVHAIEILPGGVLTADCICQARRDEAGCFIFAPELDLLKIAVIERHRGSGRVGLGLLKGYGLRRGALALSIAHDSHNIIAVGAADKDMQLACTALLEQGGGIALALDGQLLSCLPLTVAGLMSEQTGTAVSQALADIHRDAHERLGVKPELDAVMTLSFMSLAVIPALKLTDRGLFDVNRFEFTSLDA